MTNALRAAFLLGTALTVTAPALAQGGSFENVTRLEISDLTARVNVLVTDGGPASVDITNNSSGADAIGISEDGETLRLAADRAPDHQNFWRKINWDRNGDDAFEMFMKDKPVISISVPRGTDMVIDDVVSLVTIGDLNSDLTIEGAVYIQGMIGATDNADIDLSGGGKLRFGEVASALSATISGSGDLTFTNAATADLSIRGSGDIDIRNVAGDTEASIRGSGDVNIGRVGGNGSLTISGSGDIETGDIAGGSQISIEGSGDVRVDKVNGPVALSIMGNGDIDIANGRAENLSAAIRGSGDISFRGLATNPSVEIHGSGDVFIKDYEGSVSTKGDGDVTIGNIVID